MQTRAHFGRTSKRDDAEGVVAKRSSARELGVMSLMYPLESDVNFCDRAHQGPVVPNSRTDPDDDNASLSRIPRKYSSLDDVLDGVTTSAFNDMLLSASCTAEHGRPIMDPVQRVIAMPHFKLNARFPWLNPDEFVDHQQITESIKGKIQIVRASRSFFGQPWFDFIEFLEGEEVKVGQVRLIFENPCTSSGLLRDNVALLVRLLHRIDFNEPPETAGFKWKTSVTLQNYGCPTFRWNFTEAETYVHKVILKEDALCTVSIVPDFNHGPLMERGSKAWEEATRKDVERDKKRFSREEAKRQKRLDDLWERRRRGEVINLNMLRRLEAVCERPRRMEDGPENISPITGQVFILNPFMPWTTTAT